MYLELAAKQPAVSASGAAPNAEEEEKKAAKKAKKSQAKGKPTNTKGELSNLYKTCARVQGSDRKYEKVRPPPRPRTPTTSL